MRWGCHGVGDSTEIHFPSWNRTSFEIQTTGSVTLRDSDLKFPLGEVANQWRCISNSARGIGDSTFSILCNWASFEMDSTGVTHMDRNATLTSS